MIAALACAPGERGAGPTTPPGVPSDTAGTVQRRIVSVRLTIAPEDQDVARALGLPATTASGTEVFLTRDGSAATPVRRMITDTAGVARFEEVLEGRYSISVVRAISSAERLQLPLDARDVSAFAGGASVLVADRDLSVPIELAAGRAGCLVISEIWPHSPAIPGDEYGEGGYIELYNNADTLLYLDGMLLGALPPASEGRVPVATWDRCTAFAAFRQDSLALPAMALWQLPGTGREHPLAPGEAAVIAMDAIDHRPFAPGALDLSGADFEFLGDERDVDNPVSPNVRMIVGTLGNGGRGWPVGFQLPDAYFVARRPVDALPRREVDALPLVMLPRELILDAAFLYKSPEARAFSAAFGLVLEDCEPGWLPMWDRAPARIVDVGRYGEPSSFVRRSAYTTSGGRVVLQRTRASARDWVYGPPATPGVVR